MIHLLFLAPFTIGAFVPAAEQSATSVKLSVYYESLCPDSIRFVTRQLYPNWKYFGKDVLQVDLHPFGKANVRYIILNQGSFMANIKL